jgi:hypothetical protein
MNINDQFETIEGVLNQLAKAEKSEAVGLLVTRLANQMSDLAQKHGDEIGISEGVKTRLINTCSIAAPKEA